MIYSKNISILKNVWRYNLSPMFGMPTIEEGDSVWGIRLPNYYIEDIPATIYYISYTNDWIIRAGGFFITKLNSFNELMEYLKKEKNE